MRVCGKMCGKRQKERPSVRRRRQGLAGSVGIRFRRGLPCGMLSGRYGPAGKSAFGRTDSVVRPYRPPSGQLICRRRCADRFREQHGKSERGRYGSVRRSDQQRADRTGPDAAERDGAPGGTGGTEVCFRTEGKVRMLLRRGGSGAYLTKREYARLRSEASEDLPGSV